MTTFTQHGKGLINDQNNVPKKWGSILLRPSLIKDNDLIWYETDILKLRRQLFNNAIQRTFQVHNCRRCRNSSHSEYLIYFSDFSL